MSLAPAPPLTVDGTTLAYNPSGQLYVPSAKRLSLFRATSLISPGCNVGYLGSPVGFQLSNSAPMACGTIQQIPPTAQWVRFRFTNFNASTAAAIANACYAPTSQLGTSPGPYNGSGAVVNANFIPITFNNGGADVSLAQQLFVNAAGSGTAALSVASNGPSSTNNYLITSVFSDWMPITPIPRIDGGLGALINVRVAYSASPQYVDYNAPPSSATAFTLGGYYETGNAAVSPFTSGSSSNLLQGCCPIHGMDFMCSGKVATLYLGGDSIFSGLTTTGSTGSFGLYAAQSLNANSAVNKFVAFANTAWPGQTSPFFFKNSYAFLSHSHVDVVVIPLWSLNDYNGIGTTNAVALSCFQQGMALAEWCAEQGIQVIVCTAAPVFSGTSNTAGEAVRVYANGLVSASGFPVLDLNTILGTPSGGIQQYKTGYSSSPPHPNDVGHQAIASALAPMVQLMIGN